MGSHDSRGREGTEECTSNGRAAQNNGRKEMGERRDFFSHSGLNLATLVFKKHEYSYMCTLIYIYKIYIYAQTYIYIFIKYIWNVTQRFIHFCGWLYLFPTRQPRQHGGLLETAGWVVFFYLHGFMKSLKHLFHPDFHSPSAARGEGDVPQRSCLAAHGLDKDAFAEC